MAANLPQSTLVAVTKAAAGTQSISAVTGKRIVVVAAVFSVSVAGTVTLQSHTTTSQATGAINVPSSAPVILDYNPDGWMSTVVGEGLDIVFATGTNLGGSIHYVVL